ncbi:MAG: hypothetical protein Q9225_006366 [Loekoesia sp. 1 TL-2023]
MLRLAPTRITLASSDLDWHVRRHGKRQATLRKDRSSKGTVTAPDTQSPSPGPRHQPVTDKAPSRSKSERASAEEIPIYSDEPVPRDSQAFWDKILADAGSSARVHQGLLARSPQVIVPSDTFLENNGSVRLSIRGENEDDQIHASSGSVLEELLISPRSPISDPGTTASAEIQPRLSPLSLPSLDGEENWQQTQSRHSSLESFDLHSSIQKSVDADVASDSHALRPSSGRGIDSQDPWVNQMDVDGPSDAVPSLRHYSSTSSLQDPEPGSIGMPFGAQARKAELAASRNTCAAHLTTNLAVPYADAETFDQSFQDGYTTSSRVQHMRTRSGGLRRSRLYILEAAASSSPDKRQKSPVASKNGALVDQGDLLSLPPRRLKRYKPRSDTHSHVASEQSNNEDPQAALASSNALDSGSNVYSHAQPTRSGSTFTIHNDYAIGLPPEPLPRATNDSFSSPGSVHRHNASSSPYYSPNISQSSHSSSTYPWGMSPNSQNVSLIDLPSTIDANNRQYPPSVRPHFERLPRPFRAASRNLSMNSDLPHNMPSTDENSHYPSSPYLPSTPPRSISTTSVHLTPTPLSIYNDSLPAYSQPQTPIGLPRNGLPPMSLQNPFFTAPVRAGARIGRGAAGWLHSAFATPSRSLRRREMGTWVRRNGQENVSVEVEAQRMERRRESAEEEARRDMGQNGRAGWRMSDREQ